jgi:hypothetical protein
MSLSLIPGPLPSFYGTCAAKNPHLYRKKSAFVRQKFGHKTGHDWPVVGYIFL